MIDARSRVPYLAKAIAPNITPVQLAVPVSLLAFLGWTLVGMLMGAAYRSARVNLEGGGLASPNWAFTLAVVLGTAVFLSVVVYAWRGMSRLVLVSAVAFAALFGWGLPHLAEAGL